MVNEHHVSLDDSPRAVLSEGTNGPRDDIDRTAAAVDEQAPSLDSHEEVVATLDSVDEELRELRSILAATEAAAEPRSTVPFPKATEETRSEAPETDDNEISAPRQASEDQKTILPLLTRLPKLALRLIQKLIAEILLRLDRPFRHLGPPVKSAAGCAAIATCIVAAATWLISF